MFVFHYAVRESFTAEPIRGMVEEESKAAAFNQVANYYSKKLNRYTTELKISLQEVMWIKSNSYSK